jgi:hypothetical protein
MPICFALLIGRSSPFIQIYYVNELTGQRARDLPSEADGDTSASDVGGLIRRISFRSGTSASLASSNGLPPESRDISNTAGSGLLPRTSTPEPRVKERTEDTNSHDYYSKSDGSVQGTRPKSVGTNKSGIVCRFPAPSPPPDVPPMPWYLRPTYSPTDILVDLDGSVRAGTVPALVERLTAHEQGGMINFPVEISFRIDRLCSPRVHQVVHDDVQNVYGRGRVV